MKLQVNPNISQKKDRLKWCQVVWGYNHTEISGRRKHEQRQQSDPIPFDLAAAPRGPAANNTEYKIWSIHPLYIMF